MALQMTTYVAGRMDNVVFYKRGGTYIARSVPNQVHQSPATKQRSKNFGIAASAGRMLRQSLTPSLPFPKDKNMQSRFSGAIARWLQQQNVDALLPANDLPYINGFDFNEATSISERWKTNIIVLRPSDALMTIQMPAFIPTVAIAAPAYTESVTCCFSVAACQLANAALPSGYSVSINVPYNDELRDAQVLPMPVATGAGVLVVVAASMKYHLASGQTDQRNEFMPSSVIDARYC
jgi:hypothetical protein